MKIEQSAAFAPAMRQLPGTPIVAVDADDRPIAIGACFSADPEKRPGEVELFNSYVLAHAKTAGKVADALSAGIDLGADRLPQFAHPASQAVTVIAFAATSLSLYKEINDGDTKSIAVAGFKWGADALDLVDMVLPGHAWLHTGALGAKLVSNAISVIPGADTARPQG